MVTSAGGLVAMLSEPHPSLKLHALSYLNRLVDQFWPEISTSVPIMYYLYTLFFLSFFFYLICMLAANFQKRLWDLDTCSEIVEAVVLA